jgi:hypothetical protein
MDCNALSLRQQGFAAVSYSSSVELPQTILLVGYMAGNYALIREQSVNWFGIERCWLPACIHVGSCMKDNECWIHCVDVAKTCAMDHSRRTRVPHVGLVDFEVVVVEHVAVVLHGDREGPWGRDALMLDRDHVGVDSVSSVVVQSSVHVVCAREAHVQSASVWKVLEVVVLALLSPHQGNEAPVVPNVALDPLHHTHCIH